jgi:two-component system cell cycle response regulator
MGSDSDARPGGGRREPLSRRVIDLGRGPGDPGGDDGRIRVLIVEDDPLFTDLVTSILSEAPEDFEVVSVSRLSSALARVVRNGIGLIITDLNLPDSAGPVTVGFLRRAAPDVPIIVLSGVDDVQVALEAIKEGADEYVVKGRFSVDSLVWLVRLVLERHRRLTGVSPTGLAGLAGFESLPALQVVGRHLIHVAERTGLHLGVVVLSVEPAPRGEWADWERLLIWTCDLLRRTLRRCDVLSRTGRTELSVVLVSDGPLAGAVDRLRDAIAQGGAAPHVKVGFAAYDSDGASTLDDLLTEARRDAHPVHA